MKLLLLAFVVLSTPIIASAGDLALLRNDKDASFYFKLDTVRRTGQFVMAWTVELRGEKKISEALTEFDCTTSTYRQLSRRFFDSESRVISSDDVYRQWFDVPNTSQRVGLLYAKLCTPGTRCGEPSLLLDWPFSSSGLPAVGRFGDQPEVGRAEERLPEADIEPDACHSADEGQSAPWTFPLRLAGR